ncbi:MAG: replicative DNA helicase [Coriobacteriales bacterium]|jgi:replicative DNA helicase
MPYTKNVAPYENISENDSAVFRDRVIPQNNEAEKSVLAAMMLDPEILEEAFLVIKEEAFYKPSHQKIFRAMKELSANGNPVDQITVAERLEAKGELESVGGRAYIMELADNSFALANWQYHAQIVNRQHLLRSLITAATKISALSYDAPDDTEAVVEEAEKLIFNVTDKEVKSSFKSLSELMKESMQQLDELAKEKKHIMGVPTGFESVDRILAGMRGGDLLVLAARPGIGKTSFALNVAVNAAKAGATVAFFSLEMPSEQLIQKIMCTEARVKLKKMRTGNLDSSDWQQLIRACQELNSLNFSIDDTSALSIIELRAKARRQLHDADQGLIVVDYLQLMESHSNYKDRHLEVAEFSRGLKMLAKELNVPIIALSQLSRRVDDREGKRPQLSDLRESGSIEQDADVVMFIDRSMNDEEAENAKRPDKGIARIIIEKHRNGPTGVAELAFNPEYTRFDELYRGPDEQPYQAEE